MLWLNRNGTPAHYSRVVAHHLNEYYQNHWFEHRGPSAWPSRSADLNLYSLFYMSLF